MTLALILFVVFGAVLAQSMVGFGSAMIAMGVLTPLLGLSTAAPLVALIAATLELAVLVVYRAALNWRAVWRLILGSIIGIPFGMLIVQYVDQRIALGVLGGVICTYVVYAWLGRKPPTLSATTVWTYGAGLIAGALGGAYNISGPPVILYGDCRRWPPEEFKGNLQAFFLASDALVVLFHAWAGNLTTAVWTNYAFTVPVIGLAVWLGVRWSRRIAGHQLRQLTLGLMMLVGLRLVAIV